MLLPPVAYGASGPFAINFWFKPSDVSGNFFAYLYSHNAAGANATVLEPNQVWRKPLDFPFF